MKGLLGRECLVGVDIGTLTCRLLIGNLQSDGRLKEVRSERRILCLGEGVDRTKRLNSAAMARVIQCLYEWRKIIKNYDVVGISVVATSAVRDAENRAEFLERVQRETGFEIELLSGEEEARRTMLGIRSGLLEGVTDVLALDIGGGSTEFILDRLGESQTVRSINIGVIRLCERFLYSDPPTEEEVCNARELVVSEAKAAISHIGSYHGVTVVGTAGTFTSFAAIAQNLSVCESVRIHNYELRLSRIQEIERMLLSCKKIDRIRLYGLEQGREEVIVAGAIISRIVLEILGVESCLVSDLGLREGILINREMRPC